jgi:ABC-type Fe3+ transport system substrate-binding protein
VAVARRQAVDSMDYMVNTPGNAMDRLHSRVYDAFANCSRKTACVDAVAAGIYPVAAADAVADYNYADDCSLNSLLFRYSKFRSAFSLGTHLPEQGTLHTPVVAAVVVAAAAEDGSM